MTEDEAWKLAHHWIAAWNAHDLAAIMSHYEETIELTSPVAARLLGTDGKVVAIHGRRLLIWITFLTHVGDGHRLALR
jgi:ketosteroid isomerase-like protein